MQNIKCQLLWNDKMQNAKIFMGVFSFIQNTKFFMGWVRAFWLFGFFFASRDQNPKWRIDTFLQKIFAWCLVSICKMMDQNPNFF
jgi:hypothetical protein